MKREKTIVDKHRANFDTLSRAFASGDVCLMDCILKASGEHVAVICAVRETKDGGFVMTPFATFLNGNPYEMLVSPMEYDPQETVSGPIPE